MIKLLSGIVLTLGSLGLTVGTEGVGGSATTAEALCGGTTAYQVTSTSFTFKDPCDLSWKYRAVVNCTNGAYYYGSFTTSGYSTARCGAETVRAHSVQRLW